MNVAPKISASIGRPIENMAIQLFIEHLIFISARLWRRKKLATLLMKANTFYDPTETKLGADFSLKALAALPSSSASIVRPKVSFWKERGI